MKKRIFTVIASVLTVVMAIAMLVACDKDTLKAADEQSSGQGDNQGSGQENDNSPTYTRDGDTIYFGEYPQTQVSDETLSAALTASAGELPTGENSRNWTSYRYYKYGQASDYMWYIDLKYNGEKYRGVYFEKNRSFKTMGDDEDYANERYLDEATDAEWASRGIEVEFKKNNVYWFKYEPIAWRILEEKDGKAFLLCEKAIDAQAFCDEVRFTDEEEYNGNSNAPTGTYANNYMYSSIRGWLNASFYNAAFGEKQRMAIALTNVDNSQESTGYSNENKYICQNTEDKIFLLSISEATDEKYGFGDSSADDKTRVKYATDYMRGQMTLLAVDSPKGESVVWWLRSPREDDFFQSTMVTNSSGKIDCPSIPNYIIVVGVVPALWLTL
ncbi:MAG: DUF6273 domain-containing protein [Christensenellales bacterium]